MNLVTIARPYAKAAFNFALEHQKIEIWQNMLLFAAELANNKQMKKLISGGMSSLESLANFFILICGEKLDKDGRNFIRLMAINNRLNILSDVLKQFIYLRKLSEFIIEVEIISAYPLSKKQLTSISYVLENRLSYKVNLNCKLDSSMVLGIVIRIGDVVIDNSLRSYLNRFSRILQS